MHRTIQSPHELNDSTRESAPGTRRPNRQSCPECGGRVDHDDEHGEWACCECGLVIEEKELDQGPEWRNIDGEKSERSRVGAPLTNLMHDSGLSTTIGWQDTDANGRRLDARKRTRMQRLRRWDERFRTKNARERNLKQALGEIERMASALGLPRACRETAGVVYRRALDEDLLPGRSIEAVATASLYAAARQHDAPRTLVTVESVSRVERLEIQRAYRYISRELGLGVEPADPKDYLPQITSQLDVDEEVTRVARDLLQAGMEQGYHSGKAPAGLAAAAVYAAAQLANDAVTQQAVGDAADVSNVTIRIRYQDLLEIYGTRGES